MENHFLDRFLSNVENKEQVSIHDLELIADALINIHDYGVSFKKAFGLTNKVGRPSVKKNKSNIFKSMSDGFLGNPLFLNSFLSKVDQGLLPDTESLEKVASVLLNMRDSGASLKRAFGLIKKTGWKELDITRLSFYDLIKSEQWIIYHDFERYRKQYHNSKHRYQKPLELLEMKYGESSRNLERIISKTTKVAPIYLEPIKIKQRELWEFYFQSRRCLHKKNITDAIKLISTEKKCNEKEVRLKLLDLYDEVINNRKYTIILRGQYDYPRRIRSLVNSELGNICNID